MKIPGGGALQRQLQKQMQKFQEDLATAQKALAELRVEATAGGGVVTAVADGAGQLLELRISPEAVNPDEVEMLQDLVLAAVREALDKAEQVREEKELLEAEIGRLEADSLYIEEIARREYGMVREGEEAFRLTLPDSAGNGE